jgi:hypothetical protein
VKLPYICLSPAASALLLWQCFQILKQNNQSLMHDIVTDIKHCGGKHNAESSTAVHEKKLAISFKIQMLM